MIPILYDKNETAFVSNGLGRLRDCISCEVTEERNGIYECDLEYPVNGAHYDEIQVGRIIGVTHEESDDIQPFDIVSYTKPIDGVVTFHCVHVSYRQSYITVRASNINTLADALTALQTTEPANPFSYTTDKTSSGFAAVFDGLPKSVKSVLGGVEGSILDAYGGEYEWDRFNVRLWSARGVDRNFSIRYGVNMLDYEEELDTSGTYYKCIPYWTDGTNKVVGSVQTASGVTVTGRDECVPLDVSDKFENKPTKTQVEAMGLQLMNQQNPMVPKQNIHVEFVRLQDMGFEWLDNLYECKLCDTVRVVFPDYQTESRFKIVKTVWNVLEDRYESMELGDLSVTLAEALGISSGEARTAPEVDFVTYTGTNGAWHYEVWNSGKVEAWGSVATGTLTLSASGNLYRATGVVLAIPAGIFPDTPQEVQVFTQFSNAVTVAASGSASSATNINCQIYKTTNATQGVTVHIHAIYYPADY